MSSITTKQQSTFEQYRGLVGSRANDFSGLEFALDVIDGMSCRDFLSVMLLMSEQRSREVDSKTIYDGSHFHQPSEVDQKLFHKVEGIIHDQFDGVDFVELSPLQPFGINAVLADNDQKNVISAVRRSEVNADATTALFRVALQQMKNGINPVESVRLAANTRIVRAQKFAKNTKFLPHFKVFAQVSVGSRESGVDETELGVLSDHLADEVAVIDTVSQLPEARFKETRVAVGNMALTRDIIDRGLVDEGELRANTVNPDFSLLEAAKLDIPEKIPFASEDLEVALRDIGFRRGVKVLRKFKEQVEERHPEILSRLDLDLGRIAGIGYYSHIAYRISAENDLRENIPLADGGTVEWARVLSGDRKIYTVATGIGTELLCKHFLQAQIKPTATTV